MKLFKYLILGLVFVPLSSCENLDEVNKNPNAPESVSSNYILSYVQTETAKLYYNLGSEGSKIAGAMQYTQRGTNFQADVINHYGWGAEGWGGYYDLLRNVKIILENSEADNNRFFKAIGLSMKSYLFGLLTDLYGDVPFSEALNAKDDVYFPKYDEQKLIYKSILEDLREADALLSNLSASDAVNADSDIMYKGDAAKWKKFVNSLRLRYVLRLHQKSAEMSALGINLDSEFSSAAAGAFAANGDDAVVRFLGQNSNNSTPGGPINSSNPGWALKPSQPLIGKLTELKDPRLERWVQPVLKKWDRRITAEKDTVITNVFGDRYTVRLVPATPGLQVDTSFYVGLPVGLPIIEAMAYNSGDDTEAYHPERKPYVSFLHDRYRKDTDEFIAMNLITYSEVAFILAEAAYLGIGGASDAEGNFKKAIKASLDKYGIAGAASFDFEKYYAQSGVSYEKAANKQERILEQKWIASWLSIQSWFDWRRTGYPAIKAGPEAHFGAAIPVRYRYPTPNLDPSYIINYDASLERLEATNFIPSGQSRDHHYAKMWLLQGTAKPW